MPRARKPQTIAMPPEPEDTARVTLIIRNAGTMTPEQRGEIAYWIRAQSHALKREGEGYPDEYKVRYE